MTMHALVTGALWKDPEARQSKTGKAFTSATLKIKDGDEMTWVKLLAFGTDAQAELVRLGDGDAASVSGSLSAQIYQPSDREAKISFSLFADAILPLRAPAKARKEKAPDSKPTSLKNEVEERAPPTQAAWDDPWPANLPEQRS